MLDVARAESVLEVGGEDGHLTRELLEWARGSEAQVICIDPAPRPSLEALDAEDHLRLVRDLSVTALSSLDVADAYMIDGDHNYYTVTEELALIERAAQAANRTFPLLILHDVGWPSGRRDQYYDPDVIPADARHPLTWTAGVVLGNDSVVAAGGFRGEGAFAAALHEGGPRNGVLTAIEDFMLERPSLRLQIVPAVFGLGILFDASASYSADVEALVTPYATSALLARLETNRLTLFLRVVELQDVIREMDLRREEIAAQRESLKVRDLEVENRALWRRVGDLEGKLAKLREVEDPAPAETRGTLAGELGRLAQRAVSALRA